MVQLLSNLCAGAVQEKSVLGTEAVVVEAAAVVEDDALEPCSVEPIPSWHLEGYLLPYQQKPLESCTAGCLQLMMFATYPAQSFFALVGVIPVLSSPLLASACLLRPLHVTNSSLILLHLAIAVEALGAVPKEVEQSVLVVVDAVGLESVVGSKGVVRDAGPT